MKALNNKTFLYIGLGVAVAIAAGLSIGLTVNRTRKRKEIEELIKAVKGESGLSEDIYESDIWNPRKYMQQQGISKATMDIKTATVYATNIYNSKGVAVQPDKEQDVIAALRHARNRTDIAKIADAFQLKYKQPLDLFLKSFMDNTKVWFSGGHDYNDDVLKLIQSLPK